MEIDTFVFRVISGNSDCDPGKVEEMYWCDHLLCCISCLTSFQEILARQFSSVFLVHKSRWFFSFASKTNSKGWFITFLLQRHWLLKGEDNNTCVKVKRFLGQDSRSELTFSCCNPESHVSRELLCIQGTLFTSKEHDDPYLNSFAHVKPSHHSCKRMGKSFHWVQRFHFEALDHLGNHIWIYP